MQEDKTVNMVKSKSTQSEWNKNNNSHQCLKYKDVKPTKIILYK